jgi:glycolate oxidase FAD binding subunit
MADAVPPVAIAQPGHEHYVDDILPEVMVRPRNEAEVARVLAEARLSRLAVIAVGSGSHLEIGNLPEAYDVALETSALNDTLDHEPDDMTVTVDAGVMFGALQARLAESGQRLPIDPPLEEGGDATIGGLIAVNAYGPMRHAYGTLRDWVIGVRVAHPDRTVTKSGGRVVKNVSGYDMHKLHIGALGTLGIITQVTFKLAPLPHTITTVAFDAPSAVAACTVVMRARDAGHAVEAAEVILSRHRNTGEPKAAAATALIRVAGSTAAVTRTLNELGSIAREVGCQARDDVNESIWSEVGGGASPLFWSQSWSQIFAWNRLAMRIVVAPSRVAETLNALDARLPITDCWSASVTAGLIRGVIRGDMSSEFAAGFVAAVREIAAQEGGIAILDRSIHNEVKRSIDVFGAPRSDFEVMRRLKQQFDPHGTLAPGRYIGRL